MATMLFTDSMYVFSSSSSSSFVVVAVSFQSYDTEVTVMGG